MKRSFMLFVLAVHALLASAQDSSSVWLDVGIGTFRASSSKDGLYYFGALTAQKNNHLIKGRLAAGNEMEVVDIGAKKPSERFFSASVLYGYGFFKKVAKAYLSAGVGLISGTKRGELISPYSGFFDNEIYEELTFSSVSLPLEADFQFSIGKRVGLGIVFFTDFSPKYAHSGFAIHLALGQLGQ